MSREFRIGVDGSGALQFVHSDELTAMLKDLGYVSIKRASAVEPSQGANWCASMLVDTKEVLGPYSSRKEALAAEVDWLQERIGEL